MADSSLFDASKEFNRLTKNKGKQYRSSSQKTSGEKKKDLDVTYAMFLKQKNAGKVCTTQKNVRQMPTAVTCPRKMPPEGYRLRKENNSFIVDVQPETFNKEFLSDLKCDCTDPIQRWLLNCNGKEICRKVPESSKLCCEPHSEFILRTRQNVDVDFRQETSSEKNRQLENVWNANGDSRSDYAKIVRGASKTVQNGRRFPLQKCSATVSDIKAATHQSYYFSRGNPFGTVPSNDDKSVSTPKNRTSSGDGRSSVASSNVATQCDMSSINEEHFKGEIEQSQLRSDVTADAAKENRATPVKIPPIPPPKLVSGTSSPFVLKKDTIFVRDGDQRFSCREVRRTLLSGKENCRFPESAKNSPMIRRSVSLPSPSLSTHEDYDPYVWYSSSVKERVQRLERDLARSTRTEWVSSQSDIQSIKSLDLDRIAPDGDNYQLVFINSCAASQDSDMDDSENAAYDICHIDSLSKQMRNFYRLSRRVSDSIDWDLSFDSSVDDLSLTEERSGFLPASNRKKDCSPDSDISVHENLSNPKNASAEDERRHYFSESSNCNQDNVAEEKDLQEFEHKRFVSPDKKDATNQTDSDYGELNSRHLTDMMVLENSNPKRELLLENSTPGNGQNESNTVQCTERDADMNCNLNAISTDVHKNKESVPQKPEQEQTSVKPDNNGIIEIITKKNILGETVSDATQDCEHSIQYAKMDVVSHRNYAANWNSPEWISLHGPDKCAGLENISEKKNKTKRELDLIRNGNFAPVKKTNRFLRTNEFPSFCNNIPFPVHNDIVPLLSFNTTKCSGLLPTFWTDRGIKMDSVFLRKIWGHCTLMTRISFMNSSFMCTDTVNHNGLAISYHPNNNSGRVCCLVHCHGPLLFVTETPNINNILSRRGFSFDWRRDFHAETDISPFGICSLETESEKQIQNTITELLKVMWEFLAKNLSINNVQFTVQGRTYSNCTTNSTTVMRHQAKANSCASNKSTPPGSYRTWNSAARKMKSTPLDTRTLPTQSSASQNKRNSLQVLTKNQSLPYASTIRNTSSRLKEQNNQPSYRRLRISQERFPRVTYLTQGQPLKEECDSKHSDKRSETRHFYSKRSKIRFERKTYSCTYNRDATKVYPSSSKNGECRSKLKDRKHIQRKNIPTQNNEKGQSLCKSKTYKSENLKGTGRKDDLSKIQKKNNLLHSDQFVKENKRIIFILKNSLERKESLVLHKNNYTRKKHKKINSSLLEHRRCRFELENASDIRWYLLLKSKITKMESNVRINFEGGKSAHYRLSCGSVKSEILDVKKKEDRHVEAKGGIIAKTSSRKCLACNFLRNRSTMKLGLAEGTSDARCATFSSNRKKTNPALRSKKSHERPGGTSNAGARRGADVPRGLTRSENPASPETRVIDTRSTSETGSAAFVELRPAQPKSFPGAAATPSAALERRHPPSRLGLTVPADPAAEKRGHCHSAPTFGRGETVGCEQRSVSLAVVAPYSPVTKHSTHEGGPDTWLQQHRGDIVNVKHLNQGVSTAAVDYSDSVLDYENGTSVPPSCVQAKLTVNPSTSAPNCHATSSTVREILSQLGSVMSRECDKHVRVYGTKVSQLKKFFDSCASSSSCEPSLEFDEQNSSDAKCVESGSVSTSMDSSQQQVDCGVVDSDPILPNESDGFSSVTKADNSSELVCSENGIESFVSGVEEKWKNLSSDDDCGVLWKSSNINGFSDSDCTVSHVANSTPIDPLSLSTAELNSLIAVSRAELSKIEQPLNERSTLENYFTNAFDSDMLKQNDLTSHSNVKNNILIEKLENAAVSDQISSPEREQMHCCESYSKNCDLCYECDVGEIAFDDVDDAVLSDTSSDEEAHYPSLSSGAHYQQAGYALHTIIEESCEESERDSRSVTPTNFEPASKLERYFSWDIINDTELKRVDAEDSSTVFSDSLSEDSDSINDINREIEPSHLASSRLEKYFTSGLLGNENYLYPDDAEFLDDMPVSDFEEENVNKISRSALLNSLELSNSSNIQNNLSRNDSIRTSASNQSCDGPENTDSEIGDECSDNLLNMGLCSTETEGKSDHAGENSAVSSTDESVCSSENNLSVNELYPQVAFSDSTNSNVVSEDIQNMDKSSIKEINSGESELDVNAKNKLRSISEKEYFDESAQAIMKKIIVHLSDSSCPAGKEETGYHSAWKILETEIERMMQTVSPHLDPNYIGSTIDSNNSDYGSDTVESVECLTTDEDDNCVEGKLQNSNSPQGRDLTCNSSRSTNSFISEETLDIWRKLMVSLKKDTLSLAQQDNCDEYTKARLYIRDQIIALMHTVTTSQTNSPSENRKKSVSPLPEDVVKTADAGDSYKDEQVNSIIDTTITEALNDIAVNSDLLQDDESKVTPCLTVDEGISVDSTENISVDIETVEDTLDAKEVQAVDEETGDANTSSPTKELGACIPSEIILDLSGVLPDQSELCTPLPPEKSPDEHSGENDTGYPSEDEGNTCSSAKESCGGDNSSQFSVYVDIQLDDEKATVTERRSIGSEIATKGESSDEATKRSSVHLWLIDESVQPLSHSDHSLDTPSVSDADLPSQNVSSSCAKMELPDNSSDDQCLEESHSAATSRDTGYYSFKSSEDSILSISDSGNQKDCTESVVQEVCDDRDFENNESASVVCASKQSASLNLSLSTNNIPESVICAETKFCTLPPKPSASKVSMHPQPSAPFTSRFFSPSAAFKKLAISKGYALPSDMTIPSKYLKKYARSSSVDDESLFGAASMPHLSTPNLNESNHLIADSDRESSLTLDDETDIRRKYSTSSHSVLSLGSHSASMTSVYSAAGGRHFGYVSVSGDVLFGLNYNQKSQMMEVFVKQCRNLAAVDAKRNKSDPYVKVYLLPDKTKSGKRKTKTKKNTLSPIFNELLRFPVLKHELESRTLWLSVWNSDLFGRNDFLGEVMLALGYRLLDSPTLRWYPLQERSESPTSPLNYKGELFLALKYVPRDLSLESRFRPAPVISLRGALHVLVKEARNIMAMRSNGTSDPFCKSYLLPDKSKNSKQKTPIVKKTRHPKWYYTVVYEDLSVEELKERSLELTLWDHDKLTSNEFMGGIRLNTGTGLYHGVPVEWMDARRDEAALWQAMLERPNMWVDGSLPLRPTMQFIRN